ncbi:endonuclease/exonuclease/phosphatase family protein [Gillisia sp. JM1]|uniref:endonuclease/exonuclease/phosphatase family protein n=1 Tax=Gillisia sp. JM1 TaxID=1283286 RepID=UPI00040E6FA2|nr:endonuclease/exonuclease/phosphatase family protein [Gillisia sp. JM1]
MNTSSKTYKIIFTIIIAISTALILASLLSLVYNIPKWYLKILDFPRLQQFLLGVLMLILFIIINRKWNIGSIALSVGLLASIFIHFSFISAYLLGEKAVPSVEVSEVNPKKTVGILLGNVLISNKNSSRFLEIISNANPDLVLVMEVNKWWVEELQLLKQEYPYSIEYPLDNAYGMALYSKLPLSETEIQFLNHSKVPSFNTVVTLPSGDSFKFYGVHPVAPFPSDKYPENIGKKGKDEQKEVSLAKIGKLVSKNDKLTIVAGDFNDVSWSNTARLFGQNGNLKDVRIGRGLYNTFDAQSMIMRWPLDHFFVSEGIAVVEFKQLKKFGSDHFPLFAKFQIN